MYNLTDSLHGLLPNTSHDLHSLNNTLDRNTNNKMSCKLRSTGNYPVHHHFQVFFLIFNLQKYMGKWLL